MMSGTADTDRIPLTDTLGVDRLKNARYSEWVEELSDLVAEFQVRFDES